MRRGKKVIRNGRKKLKSTREKEVDEMKLCA